MIQRSANIDSGWPNGKYSTVKRALDGSTYSGKKLVHSALGKRKYDC